MGKQVLNDIVQFISIQYNTIKFNSYSFHPDQHENKCCLAPHLTSHENKTSIKTIRQHTDYTNTNKVHSKFTKNNISKFF